MAATSPSNQTIVSLYTDPVIGRRVLISTPVLALSVFHMNVLDDAYRATYTPKGRPRRNSVYEPDVTDEFVRVSLDELRKHGLMDGNTITTTGIHALRLAGLLS